MNLQIAKSKIIDVLDYPKSGITFKDITPLLADSKAFSFVISKIIEELETIEVDYVAGVEARGFIIAAAIAIKMRKGFIPIRKPGKLPRKVVRREYQLEYGVDALEIHSDLIPANSKVLIVDDVLATGGTAIAAGELIRELGAIVAGFAFLFAIDGLAGETRISNSNLNVPIKILF